MAGVGAVMCLFLGLLLLVRVARALGLSRGAARRRHRRSGPDGPGRPDRPAPGRSPAHGRRAPRRTLTSYAVRLQIGARIRCRRPVPPAAALVSGPSPARESVPSQLGGCRGDEVPGAPRGHHDRRDHGARDVGAVHLRLVGGRRRRERRDRRAGRGEGPRQPPRGRPPGAAVLAGPLGALGHDLLIGGSTKNDHRWTRHAVCACGWADIGHRAQPDRVAARGPLRHRAHLVHETGRAPVRDYVVLAAVLAVVLVVVLLAARRGRRRRQPLTARRLRRMPASNGWPDPFPPAYRRPSLSPITETGVEPWRPSTMSVSRKRTPARRSTPSPCACSCGWSGSAEAPREPTPWPRRPPSGSSTCSRRTRASSRRRSSGPGPHARYRHPRSISVATQHGKRWSRHVACACGWTDPGARRLPERQRPGGAGAAPGHVQLQTGRTPVRDFAVMAAVLLVVAGVLVAIAVAAVRAAGGDPGDLGLGGLLG